MHSFITKLLVLALMLGVNIQCKNRVSAKTESTGEATGSVVVPAFNADSAYSYVARQCDFGPRVPGSEAHRLCGDYLQAKLAEYGSVIVQEPELQAFDGKRYKARNIICSINPDSTRRVLLMAHWDSRPWADADPDVANHTKPVPGANDGASGVGVLLELARLFSAEHPLVGVDILLVDMEDMGTDGDDMSWGLGTQYWVNNRHTPAYRPLFGILLDMVGAKNARFEHEIYSKYYAPQVLSLVWDTAHKGGYGKYFANTEGGGVTDDHLFVNRAGIPVIDIIDSNSQGSSTGFFPQWHTVNDVIDNISPETLKAVGQTVADVVYAL